MNNNVSDKFFVERSVNDIKNEFVRILNKFNNSLTIEEAVEYFTNMQMLDIAYSRFAKTGLINLAIRAGMMEPDLARMAYKKIGEYSANIPKELITKPQLISHIQNFNNSKDLRDINEMLQTATQTMRKDVVNCPLSDKEIKNILTGFYNTLDPSYIETYNKLIRENRLFYMEHDSITPPRYGFTLCDMYYDYRKFNNFIFVGPNANDLDRIRTVGHENTHLIENLRLKHQGTEEEFYGFSKTFYNEVESMYNEQLFLKYLEQQGVPEDVIKGFRFQRLTEVASAMKNTSQGLYPEGFLPYAYGGLLSMHFDTLDENEVRRNLQLFDQLKTKDYNVDIFDILGCPPKTLKKSVKDQILKCK